PRRRAGRYPPSQAAASRTESRPLCLMTGFMLDTDTVSFALRGQGQVAAQLLNHRPSEICISSVTLAELRYGADMRRSRKLHGLIDTFVESIIVRPFDQT